jgi:hypothetical protein
MTDNSAVGILSAKTKPHDKHSPGDAQHSAEGFLALAVTDQTVFMLASCISGSCWQQNQQTVF